MKLKHKLTYFILILIVLLGVYIRFANFPNIPPSLNYDEASIGYNAYSIGETGMDEFGNKYPLYFRSLDDYKQPVYIYTVVVTQKIFGYSDFSVRFPSALFGLLSIVLIYFLSLELFRKREISLIAAFIYAIIPWSAQFSRYALEANVALFFIILGIYTFLKSLTKKPWLMPFSILAFTIASYTYLSYKVVAPLVIFSLFIIYFKKINFRNKFTIISFILLLFTFLLIFNDSISSQGQTRFQGTSILYDKDTFEAELQETIYEGELGINLPRRLFHQVPILTNAGLITRGYFKHFDPDFLFFDSESKFNLSPNVGLLYIWMLPFILSGIYFSFRKYNRRNTLFTLSLILIAPIPASVTYDAPHAIRVFLITVPLVIFSAIGIYEIYIYLKKISPLRFLYLGILITFIFFSTWQFQRQFQIHSAWQKSQDWQYGREEMTKFIIDNKDNYDKIIVSPNLEWPHVFVLYYSKYDPEKYLKQGGTISGNFDSEENKLENVEFRKFVIPDDISGDEKVLLIGKPDDFPADVRSFKTINYLDNKPAIIFYNNLDQNNF